MADVFIRVKTEYDGKGVESAQRKIGGFLKAGLVAGGAAAVTAIAAVGTAAAVTTVKAVEFADTTNSAMEDFAQSTNVAREELDEYKDVALDVFSGQFGENIEDVAETMALIQRNTGAGADEIDGLTRKALTLRDRFGKDIAESIRTVDSLIKNNLAENADEAFDIIIAGMTEGLDKSDDLLDTLNEYSQDFGSLGFTADDTLSILNSGLEAGILNTDKVADSLNEFGINLKDPAVIESLGKLDDGLAEVATKFNEGVLSGKEAFELIQDRLAGIEDPLARNQAGVLLYRSMWEDLGEDAVLSLSSIGTGFDDIGGKSDEAIERNLSLSESWENLGRRTMVALEPLAQEIAPVLTEFTKDLGEKLEEVLPKLGESLNRIAVALGLVDANAEGADGGIALLETTLNGVLTVIDLVALGVEKLAEAFEIAAGLGDQLGQINDLLGQGTGGAPGQGLFGRQGTLNFFGFQEGGVVPGATGQGRLIVAHGGEEVANPNMGQAITIGGETFAVRQAAQMASAINGHVNNLLQLYTDELTEALS